MEQWGGGEPLDGATIERLEEERHGLEEHVLLVEQALENIKEKPRDKTTILRIMDVFQYSILLNAQRGDISYDLLLIFLGP